MSERDYSVVRAIADLYAGGQLANVLCARDGLLVPVAREQWPTTGGAFRTAGLDTRLLEPGQLFVALPGDRVDGRDFIAAALAHGHWTLAGLEDGWRGPEALAAVPAASAAGVLVCRDGTKALELLAACHRQRWPGTMIGITGTNGKTTTKDLCAAMLSAAGGVCATRGNFNNRLGVPLTLLSLGGQHAFAVVEMGASAVGQIAALSALVGPRIGVITNAADAHLAEFGSLAGVIKGKGELLDALADGGTAILNADSPGFEQWRAQARCRVISWGTRAGEHRWSWRPDPSAAGTTMIDGISWHTPLPGRHNGANLTAALLAVRAAGVADEVARSGLASFQGSPHRGRLLAWAGRLLLDDSYNANPRSMVAAGRALVEMAAGRRTCAVLGAMAELGAQEGELHRETGRQLANLGVSTLVAVGSGAEPLGRGFDATGGEAHYCPNQEAAADWIKTHTAPGDVILLKGSRSAAMENVLSFLSDVEPVT